MDKPQPDLTNVISPVYLIIKHGIYYKEIYIHKLYKKLVCTYPTV